MNSSTQAKHIVVHGLVQGVGFRYFVQRAAAQLGLLGWVRNRSDATVEIHVEGAAERIDSYIQAIRQGPRMAVVERLEVEDVPPQGEWQSFIIKEGW